MARSWEKYALSTIPCERAAAKATVAAAGSASGRRVSRMCCAITRTLKSTAIIANAPPIIPSLIQKSSTKLWAWAVNRSFHAVGST